MKKVLERINYLKEQPYNIDYEEEINKETVEMLIKYCKKKKFNKKLIITATPQENMQLDYDNKVIRFFSENICWILDKNERSVKIINFDDLMEE
jgi:xylose isomerase